MEKKNNNMLMLIMCVIVVVGIRCVTSFDLGPIVRVAQCRSQCLKRHSVDGSCEWWRHGETGCNECWQHCESLEKQWGSGGLVNWKAQHQRQATVASSSARGYASCDDFEYKQCPSCKTACEYRKSQVVDEYLPSMLPAPHRAPVSLTKNDVAILMRKIHQEWKVFDYYPGVRAPTSLRQDEWIVAIVEEGSGIAHYSWEEWTPTLDSLKPGPLYEATISWRDVDNQLKRQQVVEQKRFNDRVRQFFLEKYGEKVLEWRNQDEDQAIPEEVFRRFFFRRKDQQQESIHHQIDENSEPSTVDSDDERQQSQVAKESFVVSWEPEAGGLMGNQVADSNFAQITLLPGMKYLVRIASNEGPGSFPIEVDTRPSSIQIRRIKKNFENIYPWAFLAASLSAAILVCLVIIVKLLRKGKEIMLEEEV